MKGSIRIGLGIGLLLIAGASADASEFFSVCVMAFVGGLSLMSGFVAAKDSGAL